MMNKAKIIINFCLVGLLLVGPVLAMSSENYSIENDSINFAGGEKGVSENYDLSDTVGELGSGLGESENFSLEAGFRGTDEEVPFFQFWVAAADQGMSQSAIGPSFSFANRTVTTQQTPIFAVNDYIVLDSFNGVNIAVGRIESISGNTITVDFWSGSQTMPNEALVVYKLSGSSFYLGTLDLTSIKIGFSFFEVSASWPNGYTVSLAADHPLQIAPNATLIDVSDGEVTAGAGEYGIRTLGSDVATSTIDWAVPVVNQTCASRNTESEMRRTAVIYKASAHNMSPGGSYSQTVSYYATANF